MGEKGNAETASTAVRGGLGLGAQNPVASTGDAGGGSGFGLGDVTSTIADAAKGAASSRLEGHLGGVGQEDDDEDDEKA